MKSRNKEVNIFNMSLLDILCGALGAFCFMMLSLFPDHAKVKDLQAQVAAAGEPEPAAETRSSRSNRRASRRSRRSSRARAGAEERDKALDEQTLAYFKIEWWGPADVDLWLRPPEASTCAKEGGPVPPDKLAGTVDDVTKGPAFEQVWFTDVAYRWFRLPPLRARRRQLTISRSVCKSEGINRGAHPLGRGTTRVWKSLNLVSCMWTSPAPFSSSAVWSSRRQLRRSPAGPRQQTPARRPDARSARAVAPAGARPKPGLSYRPHVPDRYVRSTAQAGDLDGNEAL